MSNLEANLLRIERAVPALPAPAAIAFLEETYVLELTLFSGIYERDAEADGAWTGCLLADELRHAYLRGWRQGKREAWQALCWIADELQRLSGDAPAQRDARMARLELLAAAKPGMPNAHAQQQPRLP